MILKKIEIIACAKFRLVPSKWLRCFWISGCCSVCLMSLILFSVNSAFAEVPAKLKSATSTPASRPKNKNKRLKKKKKKHVKSSKKRCVSFFRKKKYLQAAKCFEVLGKAMGKSEDLPKFKRYEKGQLFRNSAVAYEKMASSQKKMHVAGYLREKAVQILDLYRKDKLCESAYRCRIVLDLRTRIFKKIGYAQLAIVIDHPKGFSTVVGYHFHKHGQGNMSVRLRPGKYTISVTYPGLSPNIVTIVLKPNTKSIKNFIPPDRNRTVTNASIGLYISGFVLVAIGGVALGLGVVNWVEAENTWMEPLTRMSEKSKLEQKRSDAQPIIWTGGGGIALGLTFLVLGMAFHQPKTMKKPKYKRSKQKLNSSVFKNSTQRLELGTFVGP